MNIDKSKEIKKVEFDTPFMPDPVNVPVDDILSCRNGFYSENEIIQYKNRDGKLYYNPLLIARYGLYLVSEIVEGNITGGDTDNVTEHLDKYIDGLVRNGLLFVNSKVAWLYPYNFDFALHNQNDWMMKAPWYSALAQGRILSLFCQASKVMAIETGWIESVYKSLLPESPVVKIDDKGYYWLDEYPHPYIFDMTLNGHITALIGLYDYWMLTGKRQALELLKAGITTVKHYLPQYRNVGGASYYCLAHKVLTNKDNYKYHRMHIEQLMWLGIITDDSLFHGWAGKLHTDYPIDFKVPCVVEEKAKTSTTENTEEAGEAVDV